MPSFNLEVERQVAPIRSACWSPAMDLVAVHFEDDMLAVHRMNFQRLWSRPESKVAGLCWSPGGRVLACALEGGGTLLLDAESQQVLATLPPLQAGGVTEQLSWTQGPELGPGRVGGSGLPAAPPLEVPLSNNGASGSGGPYDDPQEQWAPNEPPRSVSDVPDALTVLVRAAASAPSGAQAAPAAVELRAWGLVRMCVVRLGDDGARGATGRITAQVSRSIDSLTALCGSQRAVWMWGARTGLGSNDVAVVGRVALDLIEIQRRVDAVVATLRESHRAWKGAADEFATDVQRWERLLVDSGEECGMLQTVLLRMLEEGYHTPGVQQALTTFLGDQRLKRHARAMEAAAGRVHQDLVTRVRPLVQDCLLRASRAQGLACAALRMDKGFLAQEQGLLAGMLVRCEQQQAHVAEVARSWTAFFSWLLGAAMSLNLEADVGVPAIDLPRVHAIIERIHDADTLCAELDVDGARQPAGGARGASVRLTEDLSLEEALLRAAGRGTRGGGTLARHAHKLADALQTAEGCLTGMFEARMARVVAEHNVAIAAKPALRSPVFRLHVPRHPKHDASTATQVLVSFDDSDREVLIARGREHLTADLRAAAVAWKGGAAAGAEIYKEGAVCLATVDGDRGALQVLAVPDACLNEHQHPGASLEESCRSQGALQLEDIVSQESGAALSRRELRGGIAHVAVGSERGLCLVYAAPRHLYVLDLEDDEDDDASDEEED